MLVKYFATRLDQFMNKHNILNNSHYGFRTNNSTSLALMELIQEISTGMIKNFNVLAFLLILFFKCFQYY